MARIVNGKTLLILGLLLNIGLFAIRRPVLQASSRESRYWQVQSVDTMKISRDRAREQISDEEIFAELESVAELGANFVAVGTPYDDEFVPVLRRWADVAHKMGLRVWFRGNFSGWEGWFGYPKSLTRSQHLEKTKRFILNNPELFRDGDAFSPCPECENGGPGDPRNTGDANGYNQFLASLHQESQETFERIGKDVITNWFSMNGDVAKNVLTTETVIDTGGVVTIDHYVPTAEVMERDILFLTEKFKGDILIGEFGAPIPDIHGAMTANEQAVFIEEMLNVFDQFQDVVLGMNYWTGRFSSTKLFEDDLTPRPVAGVVSRFWKPTLVQFSVVNGFGMPVSDVVVTIDEKVVKIFDDGSFSMLLSPEPHVLEIASEGYEPYVTRADLVGKSSEVVDVQLTSKKTLFNLFSSFWKLGYRR